MSNALPPMNTAVYPAHVVALLVNALESEGTHADATLAGSGITADVLHRPATRLTLRQMLTVCENALEHASDSDFALRVGSRMHIAACGILGYALLSSSSHGDAAMCAAKYDRLLGQFFQTSLTHDEQWATWTLTPCVIQDPTHPMYAFLMEFKLTSMLTVMRDLYGPGLHWSGVAVVHKRPAHWQQYSTWLQCPVRFGQPDNRLWFDAALMEQRMNYANPITHAMVRELCEQALEQHDQPTGLADAVQRQLVEQTGRFPDLAHMARTLGMTPRTLRRRLEAENTSYRQIVTEVRKRLAEGYLRHTQMSTEEIAHRLNYSDSANFRHAFARWTQTSPGAFRLQTTNKR